MSELIGYDSDPSGVVTLTWDAPGSDVNTVSEASIAAFAKGVARVLSDEAAVGAVVASGKRDFIVGFDLDAVGPDGLHRLGAWSDALHAVTRLMESGGKPFVAVLAGSALGAGAELALACRRRIGAAGVAAHFGFPDVALGLSPGGGATQRLSRTIGIAAALPLLLEGTRLSFADAATLKIVDELVPQADSIEAARAWILESGDALQAWDRKGFVFPGGTPQVASVAEWFVGASAMLRKKTWGNAPAARDILSAVYEGAQLDIDAALRVEARHFRKTLSRPETRAMVKTLYFSLNQIKTTARAPGIAPARFATVGVVGAGMMGGGIAHVTARAGARVVLLDRDVATAERGKARAAAFGADEATLARIHPTADDASLDEVDLIIEAVYENRAIKADVIRRVEARSRDGTVFGSNTSTLPIATLAGESRRPERFIGIHFFSPVERMELVEIVRAPATSDATLAVALDFASFLGKTPIVVNDGRGFFTSRVFATYVGEGLAMLREGVPPALIENAGRLAGMAVGPLAVADEIGFQLLYDVIVQTRRDMGSAYVPGPADDVIESFATTLDRPGKAAGRGVYSYPPGGRKELWDGLRANVAETSMMLDVGLVKRRLLYVQALEAQRCRAQGVIVDPAMGDVGSILGWGFPAFTGGVFSFVDYIGAERFEAERSALATAYGDRYAAVAERIPAYSA